MFQEPGKRKTAPGRAATTPRREALAKGFGLPQNNKSTFSIHHEKGAMKRQAATSKGLERRLRDLQTDRVSDPRQTGKITYPLPAVLHLLVTAMVTMSGSLRRAQQRSAQIVKRRKGWMDIKQRIAGNTLGRLIPRLAPNQLVSCLHRLIKAELRRGNLKPTRLPTSTVAIDGKNVATLQWHDLCRVLNLPPEQAQPDQVKERLADRFLHAQLHIPQEGLPYAVVRVHTATLISSAAALPVHQRPIERYTNEIGAMPAMIEELHTVYGRTGIIDLVTTDAGNTSLKVAGRIRGYQWHYFMQIKSNQQELYREACRVLGSLPVEKANDSYCDQQNGKIIAYAIWSYDLSEQGWLDWTHARQFIRVQRIATDPHTGKESVGNRYYVTSMSSEQLSEMASLTISRGHWRCENETHWSLDVMLGEDRRRLCWSRHPNGVLVVSVLRMIALAIMAIVRQLSRLSHSQEKPSWRDVAEHFLLVLCGSILNTEAFDAIV